MKGWSCLPVCTRVYVCVPLCACEHMCESGLVSKCMRVWPHESVAVCLSVSICARVCTSEYVSACIVCMCVRGSVCHYARICMKILSSHRCKLVKHAPLGKCSPSPCETWSCHPSCQSTESWTCSTLASPVVQLQNQSSQGLRR